MKQRVVTLTLLAAAIALPQGKAAAQGTVPFDSASIASFQWRSIGPVNMGGRITDIEGVNSNPAVFYFAAAAGGIWKTVNGGTNFFPLFTKEKVISMGDIAIAQSNPNILYAGTGEEDSRNSISPGGGVYKSTDAGLTWTEVLPATEHVGRIIIHPTNPDIVYVAALGAAWRSNPERGLYKTTDGGRTWAKSKFISDKAGFIDVAMDPSNPNVLYAASWERVRGPYFLYSGGPGSALWKTTDGGTTWTEIKGSGFPEGVKGRIGIAIAMSSPNTIYAIVEAAAPSAGSAGLPGSSQPSACGGGGRGGGGAARCESGIYRSNDGGRTWTLQVAGNNRPFYYSNLRVDPKNPERVYRIATNMELSDDGGRTWRGGARGHHVDFHAMWINPNNPDHFIVGSDGGVAQTFDKGGNYDVLNYQALGQFYAVSFDFAFPYRVCGGLQDNGSWCGPSRKQGAIVAEDWFNVGGGDGFWTAQDPTDPNIIYSESQGGAMGRRNLMAGGGGRGGGGGGGIVPQGWNRNAYYQELLAIAPDTTRPLTADQRRRIQAVQTRMKEDSAARSTRWNWNTPFILSPHNPLTFYSGANMVFKSVERGSNPRAISADLSTRDTMKIRIGGSATGGITGDNTGAEDHGTIVSLAESPVRPGILYAGTDDGNTWLTRDDGDNWENLTGRMPGVPAGSWVSHVEPSYDDSATVYVAFDNHWRGDFKPYIYVSNDFGKTFRSVSGNIPTDRPNHVHVVREDPVNPNLLYAGTDVGIYISLNRGTTWHNFNSNLPTVPVHDLKVHPRERELIAGTHGRSIWIADIAPLQQMTDEVMRKPVHLFEPKEWIQFQQPPVGAGVGGHRGWRGDPSPNGTDIFYRLAATSQAPVSIVVTNVRGDTVANLSGPGTAGIHRVSWGGGGGGRGGGGGGGGGRGGAGPAAPGFPPGYNPRPGEDPPAPPAGAAGAAGAAGGRGGAAGGRGGGGGGGGGGAGGRGGGRGGGIVVIDGLPRAVPTDPAAGGGAGGGGGRGGAGGGGGRGGGGGGGGTGPGQYLVTLSVGGERQSQVVRIVNLGLVNPMVNTNY